MPKRTDFVVTGRGAFPVDMLRYDECWPTSGEGAARIAMSQGSEPELVDRYDVALATFRFDGPTVKRWQSFGWTVSQRR